VVVHVDDRVHRHRGDAPAGDKSTAVAVHAPDVGFQLPGCGESRNPSGHRTRADHNDLLRGQANALQEVDVLLGGDGALDDGDVVVLM